MLPTVQTRELKTTPASLFGLQVDKLKRVIKDFNDDEEGMNTVEAIILLFVAAIVLLVFFVLIWPLIRDKVMEKLNDLFGQTGEG
jgi:Flp pilus assembly pilin Flp